MKGGGPLPLAREKEKVSLSRKESPLSSCRKTPSSFLREAAVRDLAASVKKKKLLRSIFRRGEKRKKATPLTGGGVLYAYLLNFEDGKEEQKLNSLGGGLLPFTPFFNLKKD